MILANPYKYLGVKVDPDTIKKDLGAYLHSEFDVEATLSKLRKALSTRGKKGIDAETKRSIKEAKKKWALSVIENHKVVSINALNTISKRVWGSRISDNENGELRNKIAEYNQPIPFGLPVSEEVEEALTCVSIGEVTITVPKGSKISISSVDLAEFKVKGSGSISIGRVTSTNFQDLVIQG
tara:strand:- start:588 stop:1133 length:546 start_codon:yes stop_codon:yes gene_type:complete